MSKLVFKKDVGEAGRKLGYARFLENLYVALLAPYFWDNEGKEFWLYDMEVTVPLGVTTILEECSSPYVSENLNQNSHTTSEFSSDDAQTRINTYRISLPKEKVEEVLLTREENFNEEEKLRMSEAIMGAQRLRAKLFHQFFDKDWKSQTLIKKSSREDRGVEEEVIDWLQTINTTIQLSRGVRPGSNTSNTYHRLRFIRKYKGRYYYCDLYFASINYTTQIRSQYIYYKDELWNRGSYYQANGGNGGVRNHIGGLESRAKNSDYEWTEIDSSIAKMWESFDAQPWIAWRWLEILRRTMNDQEGYKAFIFNQYFSISQRQEPIPRLESWRRDVYKKIHPLAAHYYKFSEEIRENPQALPTNLLNKLTDIS